MAPAREDDEMGAAAGEAAEAPGRATRSMTRVQLVERAARAKQLVRQRLGELSKLHREVEVSLRQLDSEGRAHGVARVKRAREEHGIEIPSPAKQRRGEEGDDDGKAGHDERAEAKEADGGAGLSGAHAPAPADAGGDGAHPGAMDADADWATAAPSPAAAAARPRERPMPRTQQDAGARQRNSRMFGILRGTLQRAKDDQAKSGTVSLQQEKLEKVDAKLRSDRTKLLEFQKTFLVERQGSQLERRDKLRAARSTLDDRLMQITWDSHALALGAFIKTESGPPIYYKPRSHNEATRARARALADSELSRLSGSLVMADDPSAHARLDDEFEAEFNPEAADRGPPPPGAMVDVGRDEERHPRRRPRSVEEEAAEPDLMDEPMLTEDGNDPDSVEKLLES